VKLEFLPPYSPDFNPIEEAFVELKAWMKKNYILAENFISFQEFIEVALHHMTSKPGNHFRSCFIEMLPSMMEE
jgi:transposase